MRNKQFVIRFSQIIMNNQITHLTWVSDIQILVYIKFFLHGKSEGAR